uniref:Thymus, brain and testes associated n=1 Tax=Amphiprion percula TaxID=161767 RepID=A0A3P8U225_AMPPE
MSARLGCQVTGHSQWEVDQKIPQPQTTLFQNTQCNNNFILHSGTTTLYNIAVTHNQSRYFIRLVKGSHTLNTTSLASTDFSLLLSPSDLDKTTIHHSDMFTAPDSQGTTGERSHNQINQDPFNTEFTKTLTKSSPRFGALSHHSFFSRHNPHPHRVTHIQGRQNKVSKLTPFLSFPFLSLPFLSFPFLSFPFLSFPFLSSPLLSSKQLSNNYMHFLELSPVDIKLDACIDIFQDQPEDEFVHQKTQYSADTGRIIPPSSKSYLHRSHSQHLKYPQPFQDQELTVLELLCQILQTDSLSTVQQWLLLAGQRGKTQRIGDAEVLEIHAGPQDHPQDPALQSA